MFEYIVIVVVVVVVLTRKPGAEKKCQNSFDNLQRRNVKVGTLCRHRYPLMH